MRLQRVQQAHDEIAHRDILSFNLHKRLKHMVLHFFKYAGKIEAARETGDLSELNRTLIDSFIICMATANAMNLSLERSMEIDRGGDINSIAHKLSTEISEGDVFDLATRHFLLIGGRMSKVVESADHLERGDPRERMEVLVPMLAKVVLALLGRVNGAIEGSIRERLARVEQKSIFHGPT